MGGFGGRFLCVVFHSFSVHAVSAPNNQPKLTALRRVKWVDAAGWEVRAVA